MAVDSFIKIGDIKGESQDDTHKDEIDVLSWSWGMSQSGTTHIGSGSGAGKVNVQDISFVKYTDSSSVDLMKHCTNGKHISEATLTVRKAGENPLEYLIITMKDVIVSSFQTGGAGAGGEMLTENVSLNFGEYMVKYTPQDPSGAGGAPAEFKWDIAANKEV